LAQQSLNCARWFADQMAGHMSMGSVGSGAAGSASATKRIQRELKEISESPSRQWTAGPVADDLFEWQFVVRGPPGTDFEGGIYTGRITLPVNYPLAPPSIMLLTPNGRWEVGKKICLSNTNYHPDLWQPAWGLRTIIEALRSHFPLPGDGAIGALDWPSDLRRRLAKESLDFVCKASLKKNRDLLPELSAEEMREGTIDTTAPLVPVVVPLDEDAKLAEQSNDATSAPSALPPDTFPQGLRQRRCAEGDGNQVAAPAAVATSLTEQAAQSSGNSSEFSPAAAGTMQTPSAEGHGHRNRRRVGDDGPQQRRQPIWVQLLKPPRSGRGCVLLVIDVIITMLTLSFILCLKDFLKDPPQILELMPERKSPE